VPGEVAHIIDHVPEVARILERNLQDDGQQPTGHERDYDKLERIERDHLRSSLCRSLHLSQQPNCLTPRVHGAMIRITVSPVP
jgi:hypothetical protein